MWRDIRWWRTWQNSRLRRSNSIRHIGLLQDAYSNWDCAVRHKSCQSAWLNQNRPKIKFHFSSSFLLTSYPFAGLLLVMNTKTAERTKVKFLKKGVKDATGKYYPCWYSMTRLISGEMAITLYARSILKGLPCELKPENNSDMMTDYFEKDRVRFFEGSTEYEMLKPLARL